MERPYDKHLNHIELDALVPWSSENGRETDSLSQGSIRAAECHLNTCVVCSIKVFEYRKLVSQLSTATVSGTALPRTDCPKDSDIDWHEVAAGLWPELKARQLVMHAALCECCGPLLRAAASVHSEPTLEEENFLAELRAPSRPDLDSVPSWPRPFQLFTKWMIPALALTVIVGVLSLILSSSSASLSGSTFAELAVATHKQHEQGRLPLDIRSDSQQTINEWFKAKSQLALALPASPASPGEERPFHLEGARFVQVAGKSAAFVAYQVQASEPTVDRWQRSTVHMINASLLVTPESTAVASGGVTVDSKKVSFHYATVAGYKVVTWTQHGLTYALVSQESNGKQRSCMVCHSAMRDRDLSQMPSPLPAPENSSEILLQ